MNWKVPVAVHHKLLPGLSKPPDPNDFQVLAKMSKSDPNSGVFIHDSSTILAPGQTSLNASA